MAYELYQRSSTRVNSPTITIAPGGRIVVNAAGSRLLKEAGVKYVQLLWDRSGKRMAIKAALKGKDAFTITFARDGRNGGFHATGFLRHIGWNAKSRENLPAAWSQSEKMFEVALPPQRVGPGADDQKKKVKGP